MEFIKATSVVVYAHVTQRQSVIRQIIKYSKDKEMKQLIRKPSDKLNMSATEMIRKIYIYQMLTLPVPERLNKVE